MNNYSEFEMHTFHCYLDMMKIVNFSENLSRKRGITLQKIILGLSAFLELVPLLIVNKYSKIEVDTFHIYLDMLKNYIFCENLSRKRGITLPKIILGLSAFLVWMPLLIVKKYSKFEVDTFDTFQDIDSNKNLNQPT